MLYVLAFLNRNTTVYCKRYFFTMKMSLPWAIEAVSHAKLCMLTVLLAICAFGSAGYHYTVMDIPRSVIVEFLNQSLIDRYSEDSSQNELNFLYSLVVACQGLGAIVGALLGPPFADRLGRKWTAMGIQPFCMLVGSLCILLVKDASSFKLLILGRLIVGVSTGLIFATVPMFLLECAPVSWRGLIGSVGWFGVLLGDALARALGLSVSKENWSYVLGCVPTAFGMLQLLAAPFFYDSPKYLLFTKRYRSGALKALAFYSGTVRLDERLVDIELDEKKTVSEPHVSMHCILTHEIYRTPLFLSIVMDAAAPAAGLFAVFSYSTSIFEGLNLHIDAQKAKTQMLIPVHIISGIAQIYLVHRLRRRLMVLSSLTIVIACHIIFFVAATIDQYTSKHVAAPYIAGIALLISMFVLNSGVASISTFLPSEISVTAARSVTQTAGALTRNIGFLLTQLCFYLMHEHVEHYTFAIFIVVTTLCLAYLYKYLPESKNQSLEQITAHWRKHDNRRVPELVPLEALQAIHLPRQSKSQVDLLDSWN